MSDARTPGRPIEVVDPVRVCVRVPGVDYDVLDQAARAAGTSVPKLIRDASVERAKAITASKTSQTPAPRLP
jgi:uncharacterized protein (DUF1778 family)